jgi:hypothetical protein
MEYFNENSASAEAGVIQFSDKEKKSAKNQFKRRDIALVLAIYFCYVIRMGSMEKRDDIIKYVGTVNLPHSRKSKCLRIDKFKEIVRNE